MSIEEIKRKRQEQQKPIKSQIKYAFIIFLSILIIYFLFLKEIKYSYILFIGIGVGYILQRSKFCFAAGIRDVILFKKTKVLRAILLGMLIATIGFGFHQYQAMSKGLPIAGQIFPVGIHTIIGGIIFGIGMAIAGGCISTGFVRIGEGYLLPWITLIGVFIGTAIVIGCYKYCYTWIMECQPILYLGDYIDIRILTIVQVLVLTIMIIVAYKYEKKNYK